MAKLETMWNHANTSNWIIYYFGDSLELNFLPIRRQLSIGRANWKRVFQHAQNAQVQIRYVHAQSLIRAFALHYYIL